MDFMEKSSNKNGSRIAAAILGFMLAVFALQGCVTNDDNAMPWATPSADEGTFHLPSSMRGY